MKQSKKAVHDKMAKARAVRDENRRKRILGEAVNGGAGPLDLRPFEQAIYDANARMSTLRDAAATIAEARADVDAYAKLVADAAAAPALRERVAALEEQLAGVRAAVQGG